MTSSNGSTILVPRKETIDELKTRYPDINELLREADIAGRVEALTNSEAEYIKTFSPDTFRDRVAQAGQERSERLRGQILGEPPSDSVDRASSTDAERLLNSGSLLTINKSKVAGLYLTGEATSSFESVRTDDNVVDLERFTQQIISNSLP